MHFCTYCSISFLYATRMRQVGLITGFIRLKNPGILGICYAPKTCFRVLAKKVPLRNIFSFLYFLTRCARQKSRKKTLKCQFCHTETIIFEKDTTFGSQKCLLCLRQNLVQYKNVKHFHMTSARVSTF